MTGGRPEPSALDRAVEDQCLDVLAALDDLGQDLPGSLHDARVALRKLRSTLVVFRPLGEDRTVELDRELRWLGGELSAARDVQVVRDRVASARDADPAELQALLAELDAEAAASWERARRVLEDPRLDRLRVLLDRTRLEPAAREGPHPEPAARLGDALAGLLERARTVVAGPAADTDLHRLRKRAKRIRFATEVWREFLRDPLAGGGGSKRLIRRLEKLQDLLGEHQDAVVAAAELDRIATRVPAAQSLAHELATRQRGVAEGVRRRLPAGVDRVARSARRLERRTPGVHLTSP